MAHERSLLIFLDLDPWNDGSNGLLWLPWVFCADNSVFLAGRILRRNPELLQNPDPGPSHFTSLAWAAVCANEETFDFLLNYGHDDEYLSRVGSSIAIGYCTAVHLTSCPLRDLRTPKAIRFCVF